MIGHKKGPTGTTPCEECEFRPDRMLGELRNEVSDLREVLNNGLKHRMNRVEEKVEKLGEQAAVVGAHVRVLGDRTKEMDRKLDSLLAPHTGPDRRSNQSKRPGDGFLSWLPAKWRGPIMLILLIIVGLLLTGRLVIEAMHEVPSVIQEVVSPSSENVNDGVE